MSHVEVTFADEHSDRPAVARTPEDLNALIDELLVQPYENSLATLYINPADDGDRELLIGVDPERGVGSLSWASSEGRWYSKGEVSSYDEVYYCYFGEGREFPRDSELPVDVLRKAAVDFLEHHGSRPAAVSWQDVARVGSA